MMYSQRTDGQYLSFQHLNPLFCDIIDANWRKESFKNINIYIPENTLTGPGEDKEAIDLLSKFQGENKKEWKDFGLYDIFGKHVGSEDHDRKHLIIR